jgi:cob(I)alamin adenosyltransferase
MTQGLLIVNTGDGKGKTTAALGLLVRAVGHGMRVGMLQFVKRGTSAGEHRALEALGVEIVPLGAGCTLGREDTALDEQKAREGWDRCAQLLSSGAYDALIFDELTLPLSWGWLDVREVIAALQRRTPGTHVVITGRDAPPSLIDAADLVTEMRMVKHPYHVSRLAPQAGIEW